MRSNFLRKDVSFQCNLYLNHLNFSAHVINISEIGCRIKVDEVTFPLMHIGATIDVKILLNSESSISFTGFIINKFKFEIGITIATIDQAENFKLNSTLVGDIASLVPNDPFQGFSNRKRKVLILGPGGGKILAQIQMCKYLEETLGESIYYYFDHFVGVSSGGLICALILKYKSLEIVEKKIKDINFSPKLNFLPLNGIFSKNDLFDKIRDEFDNFQFIEKNKTLHLQSRNFQTSILHTLNTSDNSQNTLYKFLQKSLSIPTLFGTTDNFADGAVGGFLNPTEIFLRFMRLTQSDIMYQLCLYLDAGFDPNTNSGLGVQNLLNQLFWVLKIGQRDSLFLSVDRVLSEFPEVNFQSFFFSYAQEYSILNTNDILNSSKEIERKREFFQSWLRDVTKFSTANELKNL
jgi:hypothetical protein